MSSRVGVRKLQIAIQIQPTVYFKNKVSLQHSHTSHLHVSYGYAHARVAGLNS